MHPDAGQIEVDGEPIVGLSMNELNRVRKRFGMLFQSAALFDSLTVGENVALPLREHTKLTDDEILRRVAERLDWVGLENVEDMVPASLSGGMRKRVGLARALAMDPAYILYDEPTTGLDPIMSDVINRLIRSLQARIGVTSVVVTHDLRSAYHVGDVLAMLNQGHVVFTGTPEEARSSTDPFVHQFIEGSSEGPEQPL
jgi:phospholipid/cholesterol/gamma-HCH transport system ATP-binding protein